MNLSLDYLLRQTQTEAISLQFLFSVWQCTLIKNCH